jgi:haloalkane dehalogenase
MKNTKMVHLGKGLHYIQEDYPHEIGAGIAEWYQRIHQ